jgi:hypothetical protein
MQQRFPREKRLFQADGQSLACLRADGARPRHPRAASAIIMTEVEPVAFVAPGERLAFPA